MQSPVLLRRGLHRPSSSENVHRLHSSGVPGATTSVPTIISNSQSVTTNVLRKAARDSLISPRRHRRSGVPSARRPEDRRLLLSPNTGITAHLVAIACYLAVALVLWGHVWFGGGPAHSITCNCGDTVQQVWWFEWLPWALTHGHDPLLTNAMWSRLGGVNVLSNTSWLAPAAVLSPITLLFGPVASFNVANLLAPVLSGWAAFALAGRFSRLAGARITAGGLYAFSPFVLRNTVLGHVGLTLTAYLPLVLLLGLRLLGRETRPVRTGLLLGTLTIVEFFISLEVLAITAVTGGLCALGLMVCRPRIVAQARRQLLVAALAGATLATAALAYPVWFYLEGPRHVAGPLGPVMSSSASGIISTGPNVFNAHTELTAVGYLGPQGPNVDYLGVGLLIAIAASFPVWWRRRACTIVAGVGVLTWVLEFIPARWWAQLPLLSSIIVRRFALPVSLCAGLLIAASIDGWWSAAGRRWPGAILAMRRRGIRLAILVCTVVAFIPLIDTYSVPFRVTTSAVPAWFQHDAGSLPVGTAVLTIPFTYYTASSPMGWQSETDDDFDLIGGWAFVPGHNGVNDELMSAPAGPVAALQVLSTNPHGLTVAEQDTIRSALIRWRPLVVVVIPQDAKQGTVGAVTDTLGFSPIWSDGAWTWNLNRSTQLGVNNALEP
jgi:hypothetical protein